MFIYFTLSYLLYFIFIHFTFYFVYKYLFDCKSTCNKYKIYWFM